MRPTCACCQASAEAVRRARHRLFLKRVVKCPHTDQRELMRGRKRQEILEGLSANASEQPLTFGDMSLDPLEDTQLGHVAHGSEVRRKSQLKALASGKQAWELDTAPIPEHLCVERHVSLAHFAESMSAAHMQRRSLGKLPGGGLARKSTLPMRASIGAYGMAAPIPRQRPSRATLPDVWGRSWGSSPFRLEPER